MVGNQVIDNKIVPKFPAMSELQALPDTIITAELAIDSSGQVVESKRIDGFIGTWNKLGSFVRSLRFTPTQKECQGPWTCRLDLEVKAYTKLGKRTARIHPKIVSAKCTSSSHNCSYGT